MTMIDLSIIAEQIGKAIAGEALPEPTSEEALAYLAAVRNLLGAEETQAKDAALNVVALAALAGMNARLKAAASCARTVSSARLQ